MAGHCHACTAPLDDLQFKGASDIYCKWCSDEKGILRPREHVQEGIARWFMTWQPGLTKEVALKRANLFMQGLPAWAKDLEPGA